MFRARTRKEAGPAAGAAAAPAAMGRASPVADATPNTLPPHVTQVMAHIDDYWDSMTEENVGLALCGAAL